MIVSEGYIIWQEVNKLVIKLPQTEETIVNTASRISNRKIRLTDEEESVILEIVKIMYEGKKNDNERKNGVSELPL